MFKREDKILAQKANSGVGVNAIFLNKALLEELRSAGQLSYGKVPKISPPRVENWGPFQTCIYLLCEATLCLAPRERIQKYSDNTPANLNPFAEYLPECSG